ncbi:hypothetical protein H5410_005324 [Solanum commersonii]|uniref:Uncharacterized protein n=1 Tax=Solanum commersonii TaxID=4109 RepID=A0A9J6A6Y1_SOLCO|nr:hypothetical protein H5410_005324 [Solanum commersonii]
MIILEAIGQHEEIQKIEIPSFYANKRIIGISTIIQDYYSKDQLMIYSNSRELRKAEMDFIIIKPKEKPMTRVLKAGFILPELLTRYFKLIGYKNLDHLCTKCNGEDNVIPDIQLE